MHASQLVEIAALAASQHRVLMQERVKADYWSAEQFWVLSRARVNEWSRLLKASQLLRPQKPDFNPKEFWTESAPILEEIFLAEVCTRIWCATLAVIDDERLHGELDPIARSVFVANLEIRRRALRMLLFARGLPAVPTTTLNMLRRDCEIWTDSFLALMTPQRIAHQFCFDRHRLNQLARKNKLSSAKVTTERHQYQLVTIRYALGSRGSNPASCAELNTEIAATILSCLPTNVFDSCGIPRPGWTVDTYHSDQLSLNVLEDLCGNLARLRYDVPGGLKDRR